MKTFTVNIYTPEAQAVCEEAEALTVPGADGGYGLLYNHLPCVIGLVAGDIVLTQDGETRRFACGEGFLEMRDNRADIFVNACEEVK